MEKNSERTTYAKKDNKHEFRHCCNYLNFDCNIFFLKYNVNFDIEIERRVNYIKNDFKFNYCEPRQYKGNDFEEDRKMFEKYTTL